MICPICQIEYDTEQCPNADYWVHQRLEQWTNQGKPGKLKQWINQEKTVKKQMFYD